ncbi:MAG: hypothetical protein WCW25_00710 [Patescibacteria group bacterium]
MQFFRNPKNILISFYAVTAILGITALFQLSCFIYENIYKTIYNSDQILILRSMVTIETVDITKFNQIMANQAHKKESCADTVGY